MISTVRELQLLNHKKGVSSDDWGRVHINLRILCYELVDYCVQRNLPVVISSIIRPMIPGVSKTDIHAKGRAFDVSVQGWSEQQCLDCEAYMNDHFSEKFGAISIETKKPRACLYHNAGAGAHLHLQVRN